MKEYKRDYPRFSLCGLNCGLCPRYHTEGKSKCPGCGGESFHLKHPSCAVITCNKKHDEVEYCFQCVLFPCDRYRMPSEKDSFISYRNVLSDFEKARGKGLDKYIAELEEKIAILELLIEDYNDGKRKSFYCNAVNLLKLEDLREVVKEIAEDIDKQDMELKEKVKQVVDLLKARAKKANIELKLRK